LLGSDNRAVLSKFHVIHELIYQKHLDTLLGMATISREIDFHSATAHKGGDEGVLPHQRSARTLKVGLGEFKHIFRRRIIEALPFLFEKVGVSRAAVYGIELKLAA
jgi:hypothetical protein